MASGSFANMSATIGVLIVPGHTALMRIPLEGIFERSALRQADHSVLSCMIGRPTGKAVQAADRRAVDDFAVSLLAHQAELVLHAVPHDEWVQRVPSGARTPRSRTGERNIGRGT